MTVENWLLAASRGGGGEAPGYLEPVLAGGYGLGRHDGHDERRDRGTTT